MDGFLSRAAMMKGKTHLLRTSRSFRGVRTPEHPRHSNEGGKGDNTSMSSYQIFSLPFTKEKTPISTSKTALVSFNTLSSSSSSSSSSSLHFSSSYFSRRHSYRLGVCTPPHRTPSVPRCSPFLSLLNSSSSFSPRLFSSSSSNPRKENSEETSKEENLASESSLPEGSHAKQQEMSISSSPDSTEEERRGHSENSLEKPTRRQQTLTPLNFSNEETSMVREAVSRFADEELISEKVLSMEDEAQLHPQLIDALQQQGYLSLETEEESGGASKEEEEGEEEGGRRRRRGRRFFESILTIEEVARRDPTVAYLILIQNFLINRSLLLCGTEEHRKVYLPQVASDEMLGCCCLQEEEEGGEEVMGEAELERDKEEDSRSSKKRNKKKEDGEEEEESVCTGRRRSLAVKATKHEREEERESGWILKGRVSCVVAAPLAKVFLVFANLSPSSSSSSSSSPSSSSGVESVSPSSSSDAGEASQHQVEEKEGLGVFVVGENTEGLEVGEVIEQGGLRALPACDVTFNNVAVDSRSLLATGDRAKQLASILLYESRIGLAGLMLGICKGALDVAMKSSLAHANIDSEERQRRAKDFFSQSIEDLRLAEMCMEIEATQMLTYNAALRRDWNGEEENLPKESLALLATLHACKTAQKVTSTCVDLLGKNGFLRDFLVEKFYRDSKTASLISLDRRSGVYRQYKDLSKMIKTRYEQSRLPLE